LINVIKTIETASPDLVTAILPEAMLCTKEVGESARKAAFDLLITMCEAMIRWSDGDIEGLFIAYCLFTMRYLPSNLVDSPRVSVMARNLVVKR